MIVYEGPSLLDQKPIVVILVGESKNRKTGNVIQSYILRSDLKPTEAILNGEDVSICGDCKLRGKSIKSRTCYVAVYTGPLAVYQKYKSGGYPKYNKIKLHTLLKDRVLRLGTYGDPAAVPNHIWKELIGYCRDWTAYTHQWRRNDEYLKQICMASVDSQEEMELANLMGWRTYRAKLPNEFIKLNEVYCPHEKVTCETCRLCCGNSKKAKNIAIDMHGSYVVQKYIQLRMRRNQ